MIPVLEPEVAARVAELLDRAFAASEQDAVEDAILACQGALSLHPESATAHSLLASLYERRGDIPGAIAELEAVLRSNPDSEADREKLAQLKGVLHRPKTPSRPAAASSPWWERIPLPAIVAAVAALLVLVLGSILFLRGGPQRSTPMANAPEVSHPAYAWNQNYPGFQYNPQAKGAHPAPGGQPNVPSGATIYRIGPGQVESEGEGQPEVRRPQQPLETARPPIPSMPVISSGPGKMPERTSAPSNGASAPSAGRSRAASQPQIEILTSPMATPRKPPPLGPAPDSTPSGSEGNDEEVARRYQNAGNYEGALTAYRNALAHSSDPGPIHQQIGICLQRLGRYSEAKDAYRQAIEAYQAHIAAGKNVEEARRAIQTCQDAIAVCEGS